MKFPIDIIYINGDKIVSIFENAKAPKSKNENLFIYQPKVPADKVFEINAGLSKQYGFRENDIVTIKGL